MTTRARPAVDRDGFTPVSRHRRQTTPSPTQADKSAVAGLSAGRSAETTSSRDKSPTPQVEATEAHAVDKVVDQSAAPAAEHPDSKQTGNTGQRVDTSDEPATPRHSCDNVAATGTRRSTGSSTGTTTAEIRHPDATSAAAKDGCAKRDLPRDPAQTSAPEHQGDGGDTTGHAADGSAADNAASEAGSEAADAAAGENAAGNFGAATGDAAGAATSTADGKPTDQADGKTIERATGENAAEPADKTPAGTDDEACVKESRPTVAAKDAPAVSIDSRDPSVSTPASLDQVRRDQGPAAPEAGKVPASSTPAADAPVSNAESRPERDRRKRKEKSERQRRARQEKTAKDAADNALLNQVCLWCWGLLNCHSIQNTVMVCTRMHRDKYCGSGHRDRFWARCVNYLENNVIGSAYQEPKASLCTQQTRRTIHDCRTMARGPHRCFACTESPLCSM